MASATTDYLGLVVFPDITGVYQREVRIALVTGAHGNDSNMHIIDAAVKQLADAIDGLATVASTGSYNDLEDKPDIPSAVPIATTERVGVVKPDGTTITVDANGLIKAAVSIATTAVAGIVKPDGQTITVDANGLIKAAIAIATAEAAGIVRPDGSSITIDDDGTIHACVTDAYTKAEVDQMLEDMSELLISSTDQSALYAAVNALMGETTSFTGLGASIMAIDTLADEILS